MKLEYLLDHMPAEIQRQTTHKIYLPGESIVRKGDEAKHVYLLTKGDTKVSNEFASGQRYTFGALDVPDLIGDLEVLAGQALYAASNEASSTCEVIAMRAETFLQWMRIDNEFAVAVAQLLAAKMYPTSNEAGRVKFLPSLDRLHSYLLKRLGDIETDLFILHTSRQQIADDIGTSVKTVNRGVVKLKEAGLISLLHGKITMNKEQQQALKDNFTEE
ncbi:MAG: Crp/Fnr family transcriptional regulator [Selenomonas sp.]|uniref:Crp/Fnr family transcriptional regulator n=1 Tax=Selenomonas sp. TaxID=2053611 RepID=UPI0025F2BB3C|nr:Crp/Fnr family transcriptional regulator [Selenomonas sp.]MCR5756734.1 Crp/Fnr family transcriptional regulator [Selenomonas sp.]